MLKDFMHKNLKKARYKLLEDGSFFAEIPGLKGVWANAKNLENCRQELAEVLEGWLLLKVRSGEKIQGFSFGMSSNRLVKNG